MNQSQQKNLIRIIVTFVLMVGLFLLEKMTDWPSYVYRLLFLIPYLLIGHDILRKAFLGMKNKQVFDENFLMAIATIGAMLLGETLEGVAVMWFYQIGELFQSIAVGKSRQSIISLMDIRPDIAHVLNEDGAIETLDPEDVEVGSIILVEPGEKIPIDGIVKEGSSSLDTAALTGEGVPTYVKPGDTVISGCVNQDGLLKIETTKLFEESTVAKVLDLVENASMHKAKAENFMSKFARVYTPVVCYSALALALIPPIILLLLKQDPAWRTWIIRALTFLVISCPCALVISIPLSFFGGIGGASKKGILIKGSNYLEALANTKTIVFDKTGTLTKGVFEVVGVYPEQGIHKDELLELTSLAESHSHHPIAKSIKAAVNKELPTDQIQDAKEIAGHGIEAVIHNDLILVGNERLMEKEEIDYRKNETVGTIVYVAKNKKYLGSIVISDITKAQTKDVIKDLHRLGITKTVMLTGDNETIASSVAKDLEIDQYHSKLLPDDKVREFEKILETKNEYETVCFVGDGMNDAPVLSRADVGIAMGALGSDAAIEAADVVLMDDDLTKIPEAIKLSKKCLRIVKENIVFAIGVKVSFLLLSALGIANMWWAVFADVGVMVLAVLNATRMLQKNTN